MLSPANRCHLFKCTSPRLLVMQRYSKEEILQLTRDQAELHTRVRYGRGRDPQVCSLVRTQTTHIHVHSHSLASCSTSQVLRRRSRCACSRESSAQSCFRVRVMALARQHLDFAHASGFHSRPLSHTPTSLLCAQLLEMHRGPKTQPVLEGND